MQCRRKPESQRKPTLSKRVALSGSSTGLLSGGSGSFPGLLEWWLFFNQFEQIRPISIISWSKLTRLSGGFLSTATQHWQLSSSQNRALRHIKSGSQESNLKTSEVTGAWSYLLCHSWQCFCWLQSPVWTFTLNDKLHFSYGRECPKPWVNSCPLSFC
jgi:hypothetical protein